MALEDDLELENLRKKRLEELKATLAAKKPLAEQKSSMRLPKYSFEQILNIGLSTMRNTTMEEFPTLAAAFVSNRDRLVREYPRRYEEMLEITYHRYLTPEARTRISNLNQIDPDAVIAFKDELLIAIASGDIKGQLTDEMIKMYLEKTQGARRKNKLYF